MQGITRKQGLGSPTYQYPDIKGSFDVAVGPDGYKIFPEVKEKDTWQNISFCNKSL